jgi:hypothetical protein
MATNHVFTKEITEVNSMVAQQAVLDLVKDGLFIRLLLVNLMNLDQIET